MIRIAFLGLAQAHQHLHWLPAALELSRRDGVEVHVFTASRAAQAFIEHYDPERRLQLHRWWVPRLTRDGLFSPPRRRNALLLHWPKLRTFDAIVTTEVTSAILQSMPGFRAPLIHIKHGAGDAAVGYNPRHRDFDLTLVHGEKDKARLIARGLGNEDNIAVAGYAKFELVAAPEPIFPGSDRPMALYNAHAKRPASTWHGHGEAVVRAFEQIPDWNFVVAPHVKVSGGPSVSSGAPNVLIDRGSRRSIDMSYSNAADVYIGDASSQVYEFLRRPRPCIFLNLDRIDWEDSEHYAHWRLGEVIDDLGELRGALDRAKARHPEFESLQRAAVAHSMDEGDQPASVRQADAILDFIKARRGEG